MKNRVTELLGCRYPVIKGAMGVICNPEFVAAVSEAGGFGLLATAFAEGVDVVREQIKATKKLKPAAHAMEGIRAGITKAQGGFFCYFSCPSRKVKVENLMDYVCPQNPITGK